MAKQPDSGGTEMTENTGAARPISDVVNPDNAPLGTGEQVQKQTEKLIAMDNEEVRKAFAAHLELSKSIRAERRKLSSRLSESKNKLVDRGLSRKAINALESYYAFEDQHREGFDLTYQIGRKAVDMPVEQLAMFESKKEAPTGQDTTKH